MNRIKIELPDSFPFQMELPVRITDINYGGHVGNDRILVYVHEARQAFLCALGYTELNIEGKGLIMSDAAIAFKKEMQFGDQIRISVACADFSKVGFDMYYLLEKITASTTSITAKVKTGMVYFDYIEKKKSTLPESVIARLKYIGL